MTTYNPYAYQGYRVEKEKRNIPTNTTTQGKNSISLNKIIITIGLIAVLATSLFIFNAAASSPNSTFPVEDERITYVGSGDTLWSIAKQYYEDASDIGYMVYLIKDRNQLEGDTIHPGQTLILPQP